MSKETRQRLLAALFSKALKAGIESETLRNDIAPAVIKKRLSGATAQELCRMIDHVTGIMHPSIPSKDGRFKYDSSRAGLIDELKDTAKERWGADFEKSLNAFVNANWPAKTHYRFLNVAALKALKERIKELNRQKNG